MDACSSFCVSSIFILSSLFHFCIISVCMYVTHLVEETKQSMICASWKHNMFCWARGCWQWFFMPFHSFLLSSFSFWSNKLIRNKKPPCCKYAIPWRLQVHHQKEKRIYGHLINLIYICCKVIKMDWNRRLGGVFRPIMFITDST